MRRTLALPILAALLLAACSSTDQNTGSVAGAGGGQQQPVTNGAGLNGRTNPGDTATQFKNDLNAVGDRVYFATDAYKLNPEGRAILDKQIQLLSRYPTIKLVIEGHCDERGTREYNLALGDRRAQSVKNYLTDNGIAAGRLRTLSYGQERPVALGSDEAAWAQNRRGVSVVDQ